MREGRELQVTGVSQPSVTVTGVEPIIATLFATGTRVGRYEIVEPLASGGMGVVFRAYDPELSRQVALKVVHQSSIDLDRLANAEEYERRLIREAQTLARLSHPNVVAAFDVGRFRGAVFIAMELIDGVSLSRWLAQQPRSRSDTLRMLVAAGRGLAAAHRAGVVHRDFKLSNVMISAQARAQVVDFGLARPIGSATPDGHDGQSGQDGDAGAPAGHGPFRDSKATSAPSPLTGTGVVMGTPGYIAPEQFESDSTADARSDQFSYASAAFHALTGQSVFRADSLPSYRTALLQGQRTRWPRSIPRAVRRVVDRGLSFRPDDRYPSLDKLVDDLEKAAAWPARRKATVAIAGTVLASALVAATAHHWARGNPCEADLASFEPVWNGQRRAEVERAFRASGSPRAAAAFGRVAAHLDQYRARWQTMKQDSCAATYLRGEQSERILGLRSACLDTKVAQIGVATSLFTRADAALVDRAPEAVRELAPLEECADIAGLVGASERMPVEPQRRALIGKLEGEVAAIRALATLGSWPEAQARARALAREAERAQYKPAQARAMAIDYNLLERTGRREEARALMKQTFELATDAKVNDVIAFVSMRMLLEAVDGERMAEARAMLPVVEAHVRLADNPPDLRIRLITFRAAILGANNDFDAAKSELEKARAECHTLGEAYLRLCLIPLRELGFVHLARKDYRAAQRTMQTVAEKAKEIFGPIHANVMNEYNNLADIRVQAGDLNAALEALAESKRISAALPLTKQSANIPEIEGRVWEARGDCARAVPFYRSGLDAVIAGYGPAGYQASNAHRLLGTCLAKLGRTAEGLSHLEKSVEICRKAEVAPGKMGEATFALARAIWAIPAERRRAKRLAEEALALFHKQGERSADAAREVGGWLALR